MNMPTTKTHCARPGCSQMVISGYCDQHAKYVTGKIRAYDTLREDAAQRGYDHDWRQFVAAYKSGLGLDHRDPEWGHKMLMRNQCVRCGSRRNLEHDHIQPLTQGGERLDPDNIQVLCRSCHARKTAEEKAAPKSIPVTGNFADGDQSGNNSTHRSVGNTTVESSQ